MSFGAIRNLSQETIFGPCVTDQTEFFEEQQNASEDEDSPLEEGVVASSLSVVMAQWPKPYLRMSFKDEQGSTGGDSRVNKRRRIRGLRSTRL